MGINRLKPFDSIPFMAFLLIPFFEPSSIGVIMPSLDTFFNLWKTFSSILALLIFISQKRISTILIAILGYFGVMIFSTLINSGNYWSVFRNYLPSVAFCMLTQMGCRRNCKKYFTTVFGIYFVLILINFIVTLIFPKGIATDEYYELNTYTFLGIDNELAVSVSVPIVTIAVFYSAFKRRRLTISAVLILLMIAIVTLLTWSATGVVSWFVQMIFIVYILWRKKPLPKNMNIVLFYLIYIGLEVLIVFLRAQNYFAYIIENILHKKLDFGRTMIWDQYLILIPQSPIFGHGVFEGHGLAFLNHHFYGTHNAVLALLVKGGVLGLITYFVPYIIVARKLHETRNHYLSSIVTITIFSFLLIFIMEAQYESIWVLGFLIIADNIDSIIKQYEIRSSR